MSDDPALVSGRVDWDAPTCCKRARAHESQLAQWSERLNHWEASHHWGSPKPSVSFCAYCGQRLPGREA